MPAGIAVYNADGTLQFSMDDRVLKLHTVRVNIGTTTSGSVSIPALAGVNSYVISDEITNEKTQRRPQTLNLSGSTLSWNYGTVAPARRDTNYTVNISLF